jgi:hypothetical protein
MSKNKQDNNQASQMPDRDSHLLHRLVKLYKIIKLNKLEQKKAQLEEKIQSLKDYRFYPFYYFDKHNELSSKLEIISIKIQQLNERDKQ